MWASYIGILRITHTSIQVISSFTNSLLFSGSILFRIKIFDSKSDGSSKPIFWLNSRVMWHRTAPIKRFVLFIFNTYLWFKAINIGMWPLGLSLLLEDEFNKHRKWSICLVHILWNYSFNRTRLLSLLILYQNFFDS